MKDAEFKSLAHPVGGMSVCSLGAEVGAGYKPDLTIRGPDGRLQYVVECEQKTDRKAYLGDLLKAARHSQDVGEKPTLIVVMKPSRNTTPLQIFRQLSSYADWLAKNLVGGISLSGLLVITDEKYKLAVQAGIEIGSTEFATLGLERRLASEG